MAIASNGSGSGKQLLEAVVAYLPKLLATPYNLPLDEVVRIACLQSGKQKLEEIIRSKEVPSQ